MAEKEPRVSIEECSYRKVLDIVSSKWTVLVMAALSGGTRRYGELRRRIADISQKMLTQTLRQLERDGLVERNAIPSVPPAVEYKLTPLGETLIPHFREMRQWAHDYYPLVERARSDYDRKHEMPATMD
ncbi:winged helix-turn-helix transcriptional regulator [Cohnella thermotolerans]|jgi:DNA-binding HxlR family transcriptional regulator|uniref:winged helix-turn-helix transcriptional regulator n=1 Tax=Cohnella thermotolerans TaxID=329858 RepID=UPI000415230B|nr:helix-turn-helix domain-containing protein [Cohnella thermotolerans]